MRIGIGVVRFELRVIEHLLGRNGDAAAPRQPAPARDPATRESYSRPAPPVIPHVDTPPVREPEPEPPPHIDVETELVGVFAESGAEEGAGAEIHVQEPWDGYRKMRVADIRERVLVANAAEVAVVELYESANRGRRSILDAAERRTKELANAPR